MSHSLCEEVWYAFIFLKLQIRKEFLRWNYKVKMIMNNQNDYNYDWGSILAKNQSILKKIVACNQSWWNRADGWICIIYSNLAKIILCWSP